MDGLGYAAAVVLAALFARAAQAKLGDRTGTAETFTALGLPPAAAVGVPVAEVVLAVALLVVPGWASAVALAVLAAFTTFLARAVRAGVTVGCNCFGSARHAPVSWVEVLRNLLLAGLALAGLTATSRTVPSPVALAVLLVALVAGFVVLRVADRHRARAAEGPPVGSSAPPVAGLRWSEAPTTLVAFLAPSCPGCAAARAALAELADRPDLQVRTVELEDRTRPVFGAYRVKVTPYFVVVDGDGVVRRRGDRIPAGVA